jgi:hypothetical protein
MKVQFGKAEKTAELEAVANRLHYSQVPQVHKPQFTEILSTDLVFFKQKDVKKVDIVKVNAERGNAYYDIQQKTRLKSMAKENVTRQA